MKGLFCRNMLTENTGYLFKDHTCFVNSIPNNQVILKKKLHCSYASNTTKYGEQMMRSTRFPSYFIKIRCSKVLWKLCGVLINDRNGRKMSPDWLLNQSRRPLDLACFKPSTTTTTTIFFPPFHPFHTQMSTHMLSSLTSHPWRLAVCLHRGIYTPLHAGQLVSPWSSPHRWPASRFIQRGRWL